MLLHHFLLISIIPGSLAQTTSQRPDVQKVLDDVDTLQGQLTSLNDLVTAFDDGYDIDTILSIQDGALQLAYAITNTTQDVNAAQPFLNESDGVVDPFFGTVTPLVFELLTNLESKKPVFDSGFFPVAPVLINDLRDEQAATEELGLALGKKLNSDYTEAIPGLIMNFDDAFNHTIAIYSQD